MVGNRQTQFFLENRQSEYFCLTYFSKLNRDQIEKKLWHFEDNPVSRGETLQKISKKRHGLTFQKFLNFLLNSWNHFFTTFSKNLRNVFKSAWCFYLGGTQKWGTSHALSPLASRLPLPLF